MKIISNPLLELYQGDALETLRELPADSIDCCVTSPPYWGLRDYGTATWEGGAADCSHKPDLVPRNGRATNGLEGSKTYVDDAQSASYRTACGKCGALRIDRQIGLEPSPFEYIAKMAAVFDEVKRVLKPTGTFWVVIGDSYGAQATGAIKPKDLCGIPWRLAFALQDRGWYLRQDIIWAKPNPMPESVTDRCTRSHEYIFLLTKSARYFFDADAIAEKSHDREKFSGDRYGSKGLDNSRQDHGRRDLSIPAFCNRRDVWQITMEPYSAAHFATFPTKLVELCILAGSPAGGMILDPFGGCGTTGEVAVKLGRRATLIELNPEYVEMIRKNIGLFALAAI